MINYLASKNVHESKCNDKNDEVVSLYNKYVREREIKNKRLRGKKSSSAFPTTSLPFRAGKSGRTLRRGGRNREKARITDRAGRACVVSEDHLTMSIRKLPQWRFWFTSAGNVNRDRIGKFSRRFHLFIYFLVIG